MPVPTFDLIEEQVLGSAASSVTFNSIPGTYKDLVLEIANTKHSWNAGGNSYPIYDSCINFNNDTGSNYSVTALVGNGTSPDSNRVPNTGSIGVHWPSASSGPGIIVAQIQSYANTNFYKTVLLRSSNGASAAGVVGTYAGLWRNTAAITSLMVSVSATYTISSGTTLRLWGVAG